MEIIFLSIGYLSLKGKYLTCQVRHTKNKSGHILSSQCFIIWYIWTFSKLHLKRLHKYHLETDIIIRHTVHCFDFFSEIYTIGSLLSSALMLDCQLMVSIKEPRQSTLFYTVIYWLTKYVGNFRSQRVFVFVILKKIRFISEHSLQNCLA